MISLSESILAGRQHSIDAGINSIIPQQIRDIIIDNVATNAKSASMYTHGGAYTEYLYSFKSDRVIKEIMSKLIIRLNSVSGITVESRDEYDGSLILIYNQVGGIPNLPDNVTSFYQAKKRESAIIVIRSKLGSYSGIMIMGSNEIMRG